MKERFEWVQSWCDEAPSNDLPRVLLIGDSITRQYQDRVRELLRGKCYVDYFSSSYAVDSPIYQTLIKAFVGDSKYAIIHFITVCMAFTSAKAPINLDLKSYLRRFRTIVKLF